MRKWKEKITKEKGYLHDVAAPSEAQDVPMDTEDTSKNDYNYLLSMPLWNLTLEKKEEILKQQREKNQELKNIQMKTPDQLWLDDLDEFKAELERVEAQEKDDMQMTVKKSLKNQDKHTKSSSGFNVNQFLKRNATPVKKYEYMPSTTGERVVPKIDSQLIEKCIKEAQQKEMTKARKEEEDEKPNGARVLSLVDAITSEASTFTQEELRQIDEIAAGIANPNKAKAPKAPVEKIKKEKPIKKVDGENGHVNGDENEDESTNDVSINGILNGAKKAAGTTPSKQQKPLASKPKKEKLKLTMDSDSEKSFDDDNVIPEEFIERRQTGRQKKAIKYDVNSESTNSSEDEFVTNTGVVEQPKPRTSTLTDLMKSDSESESEILVAKKTPVKKQEAKKKEPATTPKAAKATTPKTKAAAKPKPAAKTKQIVIDEKADEKSESEVSWPSMDSESDFEAGTSKLLSKKTAAVKKAPAVKNKMEAKPKAAIAKPAAAKKVKRKAKSSDESGSDFGAPKKKKGAKSKKKKQDTSDEESDFSID